MRRVVNFTLLYWSCAYRNGSMFCCFELDVDSGIIDTKCMNIILNKTALFCFQ